MDAAGPLIDLAGLPAFALVVVVAVFTYRSGRFSASVSAYPGLWRWGIAFALCAGVLRLTSVVVFLGGADPVLWTVLAKLAAAVAAWGFALRLWRSRSDLVVIGQLLARAERLGRSGG